MGRVMLMQVSPASALRNSEISYRPDVEPLGSQKVGSLMKSGVHANRAIDPQDICCHRFVGRHRNEPIFRKFGCIEVTWINEHSVIVERSTDTFKVKNS